MSSEVQVILAVGRERRVAGVDLTRDDSKCRYYNIVVVRTIHVCFPLASMVEGIMRHFFGRLKRGVQRQLCSSKQEFLTNRSRTCYQREGTEVRNQFVVFFAGIRHSVPLKCLLLKLLPDALAGNSVVFIVFFHTDKVAPRANCRYRRSP